MIKKILLVIVLLIAGVLIVAAFRPAEFRVVRSTAINAPAASIFPEVNELRRWPTWSPYEKLDPAMQRTFEGPAAGGGAVYAWSGNSNVGAGRMTITESVPAQRIGIKLEFYKPMAGVCQATFAFAPEGGQTRVTWEMTGKNNYLAKIICLFMPMDRMVGGQFALGLADLKKLAEAKR